MKIKDILSKGIYILKENNIEDSNIKARMVLADVLGKNKEYLMIYDNKEIEEKEYRIFFEKIERLKEKEPIQYILNNQEFYGESFYVDKNVLIPQPDTEILVEEVINLAKKQEKSLKILDLCTGSGAIAISLWKNLENAEIYASDISQEALNVAKINIDKHKCNIKLIESNLFENINSKFDIIVSNPPYIETDTIKKLSEEVKKEPILALDGGIDGLDFYKKIAKEAIEYLNPNGILAFEIGYNQKKEVENILKNNRYINIYSKKDLAQNDRIVIGKII